MGMKYFADFSELLNCWCLWIEVSTTEAEFVEKCNSESHARELADMMNEGE
jgi:hypothetical protein